MRQSLNNLFSRLQSHDWLYDWYTQQLAGAEWHSNLVSFGGSSCCATLHQVLPKNFKKCPSPQPWPTTCWFNQTKRLGPSKNGSNQFGHPAVMACQIMSDSIEPIVLCKGLMERQAPSGLVKIFEKKFCPPHTKFP